ncbi:hypothetical protein KIN20_034987 [Parelaphostrongylus tenuis]|uniref:Uncharacterized protein n=1 Tax=Parelaphostrongylus tenuis TaxID=148309 RepID=A0AAD5RB54_PARTN|nr:hypothetical protein KIN20_034987 [Parelaphostrongylus tenuis]
MDQFRYQLRSEFKFRFYAQINNEIYNTIFQRVHHHCPQLSTIVLQKFESARSIIPAPLDRKTLDIFFQSH